MEFGNNFYDSQLEAIQDYYNDRLTDEGNPISLTEAIINWFTDGHAERFRQDYLKEQEAVFQ